MPSPASAAAISATRVPGGAQFQHPGPQLAGGLARSLGAGPGLGEQGSRPLRSSVAIWCTLAVEYPNRSADLGGGHLVEEVGAQCLIPALRRAGRLGEILGALSHRLPQLIFLNYYPKL